VTPTLRAGVAALLLLGAADVSAERIRDFRVDVQLDERGTFTVEERVTYDFEDARRHGIYREIPVRYGRGAAADYRIALDVVSVSDAAGRGIPYVVSSEGAYRRIRIGDPQRKVTGAHEYRITYTVRRGILWFEEHDELYWNATGTEWPVPIDAASVTVRAPRWAEVGELQALCFTGARGSVETACRIERDDGVTRAHAERGLGPSEGLTLVVALPKGVLHEPSATSQALDRASDFVSWAVLFPLLLFVGMGTHWWRNGRDPTGAVAIPVRYEPPEGMSPAEMGTVLDERADLNDITATILDLAVRGYLRIEEMESKRFFFLSETGYKLHKLEASAGLKPHEVKLMSSLFGVGSSVDIADLKNSFYKRLPEIRSSLYAEVSREGRWFPTSPDKVRSRYRTGVLIVAALGGLAAFGMGDAALLVAMGAFALVGLLWARKMPRRTKEGRRARQHIAGFAEFMERVEVDRLERLGLHTVEQFEKILPYAFVLGAADAWSDAFAHLYTAPPAWYSGPHGGAFRPRLFVDRVGRSLQTVGSAMTSQPRGSGSSGLRSGGGFSGGGFGGGGGGSW
jgi:hypothetical protein